MVKKRGALRGGNTMDEKAEKVEKLEPIEYEEVKTNLRCINCGKKLKKRIYSNGKIRYVCERCEW